MADMDWSFDPHDSTGASRLKKEASRRGTCWRILTIPMPVVTNTDELGQLAERVCASWWDRLEKNKSRKIDLQEVRRVYVGAFIASYMRGIDHKTPYEEKLARRTHMAQTGGTTMKVTKARYYDDRAVYEVGLVDRLYLMTPNNTVSFEVHFDRHGKLVLSKFDDHD